MEIGKTLQDKRTEKGYSLKDIEDATKIRSKYIRALEDEDFSVLPGRVYGKAFLRTYARFLGLDSDRMISIFDELFPQEKIKHRVTESGARDTNKVVGLKKYFIYIISLLLIVGLMYTFNSLKNNLGREEAEGPPETDIALEENNPPETGISLEENNPPGVVPPEQQTLILNVVTRKCWIEVYSDDQIAYSQIAFAGETLEFEAKEGFRFTLGDAGAVEVIVNGENYGILGREGAVVHYPEVLEGDGE